MIPARPERRKALAWALGTALGFPVGALGGFTGVGGGEYRTPILLLLTKDIRVTIATNLAIGIAVSAATFILRDGFLLAPDYLWLALALSAASLPGAYLGAILTRRVSARKLKLILALVLAVTGLRLVILEAGTGSGFVLSPAVVGPALAFGFALGIISGLLGLTAGEYRIPILILVFGLAGKVAGTVSSLAAIPQQVLALWEHRRLSHMSRQASRLGLAMGTASVLGVALGVTFLGGTTDVFVTRVLGLAMVAAAIAVVWQAIRPERRVGSGGSLSEMKGDAG